MNQFIKKTWRKISNVGIEKISDADKARNVIISNRLVFIIFITMLILFLVHYRYNGWNTFNQFLLFGNFGAFTMISSLNRLGFSLLSRIILSWMCSIYPFISSINVKLSNEVTIEEPMYFMPRLFIMTTSVIPILVFNFKEKVGLALGLMGSFIPLFFFDPIHQFLNIGYFQMGFESISYFTFHVITLASYVIFIVATIFFKRENEKYERRNLSLIDSLEKKNAELTHKNQQIEKQSKDLESANYEISIINSNLEKVVNKRTKKLLDQATQFQMFSFKNSHELRAPLTNVMGIIELLKEAESQEEINKLLILLNKSCKDLDKVVHEINEILNESYLKE
ncbi:histidine kinase dimerization/phospho-acceptor domain-containing protein [Ekhidna sp.]|uniref:histidine kinase dimerization/phospho-acceptor domain-containing protein n=1 Tax=Ekhidna sp. TaxID=2608089 RepID=UPI0032EBCA51